MKSKKKCSVQGCRGPLFARGYCPRHYKSLYLAPKQAEKLRKSYTIPQITAKRSSEVSKYHRNRKSFISRLRAQDKLKRIFCTFCGGIIFSEPSLHHANGRDDESILDERYWMPGHNHCHVQEYHSMSWKDIPWWNGYLSRIKDAYPDIYKKELIRMSK